MNAIQSVTLTQQVNSGTELTIGSTCANMLEATLITPDGCLNIPCGAELTLYKVADDGTRTKVGLFTAEKCICSSRHKYKIVAYDRVSWLDRDLSKWLEKQVGWPYPLLDFAKIVCDACQLTLLNDTIPNGDWRIQEFSARGITGRQLMQWVGQACGRFCRATPDGDLELAWYTPREITLAPGGELPVIAGQIGDYTVAPVDKVEIHLKADDKGASYGTGDNAYLVIGNGLLNAEEWAPLKPIAQTLYQILQGVSYTPCKLKIPSNTEICPGDILSVTDRKGSTMSFYVMKKTQTGRWEVLECTGNPYRVANGSRM